MGFNLRSFFEELVVIEELEAILNNEEFSAEQRLEAEVKWQNKINTLQHTLNNYIKELNEI